MLDPEVGAKPQDVESREHLATWVHGKSFSFLRLRGIGSNLDATKCIYRNESVLIVERMFYV